MFNIRSANRRVSFIKSRGMCGEGHQLVILSANGTCPICTDKKEVNVVAQIKDIEIYVNDEIVRIAQESKLIIEQFQKLLGVYTTTEALAKIAVLMREEEAESLSFEFIRKVRDGEHHTEHDDEPCRCNEIAAAKFLKNWSGV